MIRAVGRPAVGLALVVLYVALVMTMLGRLDLVDRVVSGFRSAADQQQDERVHENGRSKSARARDHPARGRTPPESKRRQPGRRSSQSVGDELEGAATSVLGSAWRALRLPLLLFMLSVASITALRARSRRRRLAGVRRFELRPSREDTATPYQREKLFDAWHGQLCPRWWERLLRGPPSIALEVHQLPDDRQALALAATQAEAAMIEGRLSATYPDVSLRPLTVGPTWGRCVTRLKKRRVFVARIQTVKDDEQALMDSIIATMARVAEPATVQLVLTPAPWLAHRLSRRLLKLREQELTRGEHRDRADIGVDSVVEDKELKGALETQHRSLFWVEIRVASDSREAARALAGLFSEAHSENALVGRNMRLRGWLYRRRIALGAPNPLPPFLHGVLSSSELAALVGVPRQRVKTAQLVRAPNGRALAGPQITRDPALEIMRDERGPVGIKPADRKYGQAFIGAQGVGKTSGTAKTIEIDARDRDAAMIVADPNQALALLALSLIPADRTVWYMDLARPEVGINPLQIDAGPDAVADVVLQAMKEAHEPGAILSQSDEFLRNAALAVCAVEPEPTLWHMYELLSPRRTPYRERVVDRLDGMEGMAAVARYWGQTFPDRWMDSRTHMAGQLAAPLNKINRLLTSPSVDIALRHPFALDIAEVIRNREVLIVNGALGEVGEQNAVVVLQFLLQLVHQAMKQQQRLPPEERVRVCLKIDEAHLVLTPSFATMLALHRAAGPLEVTAAWQYSEQVADRTIRSGLKSLLRSRSMFAMGEVADAREQAEVAMEVYSDLIRGEQDDRERARFGPDDIVRLPIFEAINSWVADGARQTAFYARTLPLREANVELREHHLARQREAGAFWPAVLADPLEQAPVKANAREERADESASEADQVAPVDGEHVGAQTSAADVDPADAQEDRPEPGDGDQSPGSEEADQQTDSAEPKSPAPEAELPATYRAVHPTNVLALRWDKTEVDPQVAARLEPQVRDLEIVRALWRHEVLLLSHLWQEWWPDRATRAAQLRLVRLVEAGWLRRFQLQASRGRYEAGYVLARAGFAAGQAHHGPDGPYIPTEAKWQERRIADYRTFEHRLQTNAWVLCFRRLVCDHAVEWRGEREGRLEVPTKLENGRRVPIGAEDLRSERYRRVRDLRGKQFGRVWPDATVTMDMPHRGRRFDLMLELDRTGKPTKNLDKFHRYDALLTGWWQAVERYRRLGEAPAVIFICIDEAKLESFMRAADREVTGRLARPGTPEDTWPYPGRERMLFCSERDVHEGSLRAFKLPAAASDARPGSELEPREVRLPGGPRQGG